MAKIGILTFHSSHNFGSMLQAYAMQTFLEKLGHEVKIIDHYSYEQKAQYPKLPINITLSTLKEILRHPYLTYQKYKGWYKFRDFMRKHLHLTRHAAILAGVKNVIEEEEFDVVLSAGDQTWNINCLDFCLAYYLPFHIKAKKMSYAISMGGLTEWNPIDYQPFIKATLKDYDSISVRENSTAQLLSSILHRQVDVMPDTAWLISKDEYDEIMIQPNKPIEKGSYMVYYSPGSDVPLEWAITYSQKMNMKLIVLSKLGGQYRNVSYRFNVGPSEFLNYIKYAHTVIGCSLHLMIFSIMFNKNFIILHHMNDKRLVDLAHSIGIEDRLVSIEASVSSYKTPTSCVESIAKKVTTEYLKIAEQYFNLCLS